jgi:hypothetical protein
MFSEMKQELWKISGNIPKFMPLYLDQLRDIPGMTPPLFGNIQQKFTLTPKVIHYLLIGNGERKDLVVPIQLDIQPLILISQVVYTL